MQIEITTWTVATVGPNSPLTVAVRPTEEAARQWLLCCFAKRPPGAATMDVNELAKWWPRHNRGGVCQVTSHQTLQDVAAMPGIQINKHELHQIAEALTQRAASLQQLANEPQRSSAAQDDWREAADSLISTGYRLNDASKALHTIHAAERDHLTVDAGNVVDLLADNHPWSLQHCRTVARLVGYDC